MAFDSSVGLGVVVGAAVGQSFGGAFATVDERLNRTRQRLGRLRPTARAIGAIVQYTRELDALRRKQITAAGAGQDLGAQIRGVEESCAGPRPRPGTTASRSATPWRSTGGWPTRSAAPRRSSGASSAARPGRRSASASWWRARRSTAPSAPPGRRSPRPSSSSPSWPTCEGGRLRHGRAGGEPARDRRRSSRRGRRRRPGWAGGVSAALFERGDRFLGHGRTPPVNSRSTEVVGRSRPALHPRWRSPHKSDVHPA